MTAIVGILNKRAAVMAADSAVTVSNDKGVKIYNTATKIFSLSDEHPITKTEGFQWAKQKAI